MEQALQQLTIVARAKPVLGTAEQEAFYAGAIRVLARARIPFLVAGTFALSAYTGISRPTKDFDIFCKAGDWPRILSLFKELGMKSASRMSGGSARSPGATSPSM